MRSRLPMSPIALLVALLVGTTSALRLPVNSGATRRAVLGSALSVALPQVAFADSVAEIAAASNAEAEEVRIAEAVAAEDGPGIGKTLGDGAVIVAFLALLGGAGKLANQMMREPCAPLAEECNVASYEGVVPDGWEKVPSRSRPGQFSFKDLESGEIYSEIPSTVMYKQKYG